MRVKILSAIFLAVWCEHGQAFFFFSLLVLDLSTSFTYLFLILRQGLIVQAGSTLAVLLSQPRFGFLTCEMKMMPMMLGVMTVRGYVER